jgi:serine/threonine-protein kinase
MSGQAHEITARILAEVGTLTEARLHFENAAGLDLGRAISISSDVARLDALEGNFVAADVRVAALRANPDVPIMQVGALVAMRLAAWRRDHAMVIEAARVFATLAGPTAIAIVDKLERAFESQTVDMVAWDELVHRGDTAIMPKRPQVFMLQLLAETAALLQRPDLSIATLERAMHHGLIDINWLDRCPLFDPMRSTPAFRAVRDLIALRAARVLAALRPSRAHEVLGSA